MGRNASWTIFSSTTLFRSIVVNATSTDGVTFVSETIPDNTTEPAGQSFTKTWTVRNSGTTTWNSGYSLQYVSSTDRKSTRLNTSHRTSSYAPISLKTISVS